MTMKTHHAIKTARQNMHRAERQLALAQIKERKAAVRRKIELGDLIIQSGLDGESNAVILGILMDAVFQLEHNPDCRHLFQIKGAQALMDAL